MIRATLAAKRAVERTSGFGAIFGMFALLYAHALRECELELDERETLVARATLQARVMHVALALTSATLAWFGPPNAVPFAGLMLGLIGPLMWWHWSRVQQRLRALSSA